MERLRNSVHTADGDKFGSHAELCPALELHWDEPPKTVLIVAKPGGGAALVHALKQVRRIA